MSAASFTERLPRLFKDLGEREIAAPLRAPSSMGEGGWEVGFEEVRGPDRRLPWRPVPGLARGIGASPRPHLGRRVTH